MSFLTDEWHGRIFLNGWSLGGAGPACFLTDEVVIHGLLSWVSSSGGPAPRAKS